MGRNVYEDPYQLLKVDPLIYGLPESLKTKRDILLEMIPYVMQQNNSGEKIQLVCKHFMGLAKGTKFAKNIRSSLARLHTFKRPEKKLIQIANQLG